MVSEIIAKIETGFSKLNNNNYFIGIMMILLNIGSKYFMQEFGTTVDFVLNIKIIRRLLIFTVFFVATRDIKTSLILTGVFIIITLELFNEKSQFCIIPKNIIDFMDQNKDGVITADEIKRSISLLQRAGYVKNSNNTATNNAVATAPP